MPVAQYENPNCLLCGAATKAGRVNFNEYRLYCCRECRFQFLDPDPTAAALAFYDEHYYERWGEAALAEHVRSAKKRTFRSILERGATDTAGGRLLDVGCGPGHSLEVALEMGWDAYGLDLNPAAKAGAASSVADRITIARAEELGEAFGTFDVILANDVIEHLRDPASFVAGCRRLLRPGGMIIVTTVDTASVSCKVMGRYWPHYIPEHLCYFDRHNLGSLLCSSGFGNVNAWSTVKYLCPGYVMSVLDLQKHEAVSGLARIGRRYLPAAVQGLEIPVLVGQFSIAARREG